MFKLANKPPRGPEDLSLSDSGRTLLKDSLDYGETSHFAISLLGKAACVELADTLDGITSPETKEFNNYGRRILDETSAIFDRQDRRAFLDGFNMTLVSHLRASKEGAEVA